MERIYQICDDASYGSRETVTNLCDEIELNEASSVAEANQLQQSEPIASSTACTAESETVRLRMPQSTDQVTGVDACLLRLRALPNKFKRLLDAAQSTFGLTWTSYREELELSCTIFLFCNVLFGLIAFFLAVFAHEMEGKNPRRAKCLSRTSVIMSIAGIIVTVIIVATVLGVIQSQVSSKLFSSSSSSSSKSQT